MKVLLINTHLTYPNWSDGALNKSMIEVAKKYFIEYGHEIIQTNVEEGYNPEVEVQKHVDADLVILQTPINWFGSPWIYKKYVDEVFNVGLNSKLLLNGDGRTRSDSAKQYGTGGNMQGKKFFIASTWNAPLGAFNDPEQYLLEGKSVEDLLLNITSNYKFVGYDILEGYGIHDIFKGDADIKGGLKAYREFLSNLDLDF